MEKHIKGSAIENATSYTLYKKEGSNYTELSSQNSGGEIDFLLDELNLAPGDYILTVKAKADGFEDSDYSNEISLTIEDIPDTDYWVLEKASGTKHADWISSSLLGSQYFMYNQQDSLDKLQGKTINGIACGLKKDSTETSKPINVYLVKLDNNLPTNWELKQTVTLRGEPGVIVEIDLEDIYIPAGYTIGINTSAGIGTYNSPNASLGTNYYNSIGATTSTKISINSYDFRIKVQ